jgi:hypothetical protein
MGESTKFTSKEDDYYRFLAVGNAFNYTKETALQFFNVYGMDPDTFYLPYRPKLGEEILYDLHPLIRKE